jgi:hypothetical protein
MPFRSLEAMVNDHHRLIPVPRFSRRMYARRFVEPESEAPSYEIPAPNLLSKETLASLLDLAHETLRLKVAYSARFAAWQRPVIRFALDTAFTCAKWGCHLMACRPSGRPRVGAGQAGVSSKARLTQHDDLL